MAEAQKPKIDYRVMRILRYYGITLQELSAGDETLSGDLYRLVEYDANGEALVDIEYDEEGNELERYEYTRDEKGRMTERKHFSYGDELDRQTFEYDEKGNLVKEYRHYLEGEAGYTAYTYNENGKLTEKRVVESEDEPQLRETTEYDAKWTDEVVRHCEYVNDEKRIEMQYILREVDGKPDVAEIVYTHADLPGPRRTVFHDARTSDDHLYSVTYDAQDRIIEIHRAFYDEQGRKEKDVIKNGEAGTLTETRYTHDEENRISGEERFTNGQPTSRAEYRFDEKGRIAVQMITSAGGFFTDTIHYE